MTIATRALRGLHGGRRLLVLAVVVAAVGLIALSGARPARAGGLPDLTVDRPTLVLLPANTYPNTNTIPGWFLILNVRNIGTSNVNQSFRVAVIVNTYGPGTDVDINKTFRLDSLAAGAGKGAMLFIGGCTPGDTLSALVYADIDFHIDELTTSNNEGNRSLTC